MECDTNAQITAHGDNTAKPWLNLITIKVWGLWCRRQPSQPSVVPQPRRRAVGQARGSCTNYLPLPCFFFFFPFAFSCWDDGA